LIDYNETFVGYSGERFFYILTFEVE